MRREIPEINAGSMADIAFLLLIFFLVTTTMSTDLGIPRMLPPKVNNLPTPPIEVNDRNIMVVLVNRDNKLMIDKTVYEVSELRGIAKEFIANPNDLLKLPEKEEKQIDGIGPCMVSKQIISLQSDRGTSYGMYIQVQNELTAAYNELRDEYALQRFNRVYDQLAENLQRAVKSIYPMRISEAEPNN